MSPSQHLHLPIVTILIFTLLFSCNDSTNLTPDKGPITLIGDTTRTLSPNFETIDDLQIAINDLYFPYMKYHLNSQAAIPTLGGDDVTTRDFSSKTDFLEFEQFRASPNNIWLRDFIWNFLYDEIILSNVIIQFHTDVPESERRNEAIAQAYFLRAWACFQMVRTFGPLPIIEFLPSQSDVRQSEQEVYAFIVDDLTRAITSLPNRWENEPGRINVWAAKLMLAKVHLHMAGWPLNDLSQYTQAASLAKDVVDNSGYHLVANFEDLWRIENNNNTESILAVQACTTCDGDWALSNRFSHSLSPGDIDANNAWGDYFAEIAFFNEFPEGPRKEATFLTSVEIDGNNVEWTDFLTGHPYYLKLIGDLPIGTSNMNWYVLRYSEALLIYAEAQAMSDGAPNAEAYEALNKIRRRATGFDIDIPNTSVDLSGLSTEEFRDAVVAETAWEFAGEWHRWFNLVRLQKVAEATAKRHSSETSIENISINSSESEFRKFYYAPIPSSKLEGRPDWTQNECCN